MCTDETVSQSKKSLRHLKITGSQTDLHQYLPDILLKHSFLGPTREFLIQYVSGGVQEYSFLTNPHVILTLPVEGSPSTPYRGHPTCAHEPLTETGSISRLLTHAFYSLALNP